MSSTKSCRDAFLRLGTRDCRMKLAIAEAWRFAETQECVSTGGRVFVFCAASLANRAWHGFHDSRQGRRGGGTLTPASPTAEKSVETRRATSPVIWNVRGISVSSTKSCRDAFLRLGTRDCRMKLAIAEAWRFAETQECVSTGGRVFVFCAASLAKRAWHGFHDSRRGRRGAPRLYIVRAERDSPRSLSAAPFSRVFREIIAKKWFSR